MLSALRHASNRGLARAVLWNCRALGTVPHGNEDYAKKSTSPHDPSSHHPHNVDLPSLMDTESWSEERASVSEAVVKADKTQREHTVEEMQEITIKVLEKRGGKPALHVPSQD